MTRRDKGDGSIYQRSNGRFVGEYTDANGKRRYVSGKDKNDVKAKLKEALKNKDEGVSYDAGTLAFGDFLDRWLGSTKGTIRERSWIRYEQMARVHLKPTLGRVKLSRLNALQLQDLYTKKLKDRLSPRTVQYIHTTAHKALGQGVAWSLIPRNVADAAKPPKPSKGETHALSLGQIRVLLEAVRGDKLEALYVLACTTGMRQSEIIGLQWRDIDLEDGVLKISRSVYNGAVSPPKSTAGRRTIRLSKLAVTALKAHRINTARTGRIAEWVFSSSKGTPLSCHNLHNRSWKPLLHTAGLPHSTRFHDLRHSAATLLISRGIPVKVVSEMLGHADVTTTISVYFSVMPNMQSLTSDGMDEALG